MRRRQQQVAVIRCDPAAEECGEECRVQKKGYVPVLVGSMGGKEEELQKFLVGVEVFKHPCFVGLLETAAQEFGYQQKGVLRIPCDAQHFDQVWKAIAKSVY